MFGPRAVQDLSCFPMFRDGMWRGLAPCLYMLPTSPLPPRHTPSQVISRSCQEIAIMKQMKKQDQQVETLKAARSLDRGDAVKCMPGLSTSCSYT